MLSNSWLRKARSNTEPTSAPSAGGESSTSQVNENNTPGDKPLAKPFADGSIYRFHAIRGQPDLHPISIGAYNLDWVELLPFLRETFPEQVFEQEVSS